VYYYIAADYARRGAAVVGRWDRCIDGKNNKCQLVIIVRGTGVPRAGLGGVAVLKLEADNDSVTRNKKYKANTLKRTAVYSERMIAYTVGKRERAVVGAP